MGCDIHSYAEIRKDGRWQLVGDVFPLSDFDQKWEKKTHGRHPFDWRSYGLFGFLADVRNYSRVPTIQQPTYELPADASPELVAAYGEDSDWHSLNTLTLKTLLDYDYDQTFWDRRVTKQIAPNVWDGAALADEGEGEIVKLRDFLGEQFFQDLEVLKSLGPPGDVRVVFWFDN